MRFERLSPRALLRLAVLPLMGLSLLAGSVAALAATAVEDVNDAPAELVRPGDGNAHLPAQELTANTLYHLLLAEIAGQRDRLNVAVTLYLELARTTHDPRISQRATDVALAAHNPKAALEAARLWVEQDPDSDRARQDLSALLVQDGKLSEAEPYLKQMLSKAGTQTGDLFMSLHTLLSGHSDKAAVLALVQDLAKPYPKLPEASYAIAVAALDADRRDLALSSVREADTRRPGWESAAVLHGQILLANKDEKGAREFYHGFLARYPKSQEVRLMFARQLVDEKLFPAAREQFQSILKNSPDNPDVTLAVGLLSMQLKDYGEAERDLQRALNIGYREPDTIRFYLGQLHEEQKDWPGAAQWYGKVESGDQYVPARMRIAVMLSRQNRLQEGRDLLHSLPAENNEQRSLLVQADAQLLSDAHDYQTAWTVLSDSLTKMPDSADLLYDRAMVAEKMDRIDLLEADLRQVITLQPNHAHAYNALGYTLADRTQRYAEALELIQKAVSLSPEDPFIIDSLGWVQYRLGHLGDATKTLKDAYARQPDPEIAAHLGEVLWAQGSKDEATHVWQTSYKTYPDSEALRTEIEHHPH